MKVDIVKVGSLECNCYILDIKGKVLVIDPGAEYKKIKEAIGKREVVGVIVTHYHFDHVGALRELMDDYNIKVSDYSNLKDKEEIGEFKFKVIKTPGHTSDSITIYFVKEKMMFVGDFIFKDSIGRCDLPTGSVSDMVESINKIKQYADDITIYPGHGDLTYLGYEKENNYYFHHEFDDSEEEIDE